MNRLARQNPKIPEGINHHNEKPLAELFQLLMAVGLLLGGLLLAILLFSRWLVPYVPFSWEQHLARPMEDSPAMVYNNRIACVSPAEQQAAEQALQQILNRLVADAELPGGMTLQGHFIELEQPNAFATLGGHLFVTTGLMQEVSSENALAMVLAHELAHVQYRHPLQALSRGVLLQLALGLLGINQDSVSALVTPGSMLTLLSFSRDMEREADAGAIALLQKRYGGLQGADEFFVAMSEAHDEPAWQAAIQTHPAIEERLHNLVHLEDRGKALQPLPEALVVFKHQLRYCQQADDNGAVAAEGAE